MGRLIAAIDPQGRARQFLYDPAGDLLDHLPDNNAPLREATFENHTYRFDAAGNLVQRQQGRDLTSFSWDENNRLRSVRTPDGPTVHMAYDAIGRRSVKSVDGERTFFFWDGEALLAEQHEEAPAREYVYHPGTHEPLAVIDGDGTILYYHNDVNGLPCELTKSNGEIVWSAVYDALGRIDSLPVADRAQPLRFQGQYWDEEIELCYNRHRYFDPHCCSFISQDPIGLAGGENLYAYAPNVWGWIDPLGLSCKASRGAGQTTILGENMMQRVIPYAQSTQARTLPFGTTAERWATMTPAQRWRLNDGALRARIGEGDTFRYIGRDPFRDPALRTQFDLTGSELLRLQERGIRYQTVPASEVQRVIGRP